MLRPFLLASLQLALATDHGTSWNASIPACCTGNLTTSVSLTTTERQRRQSTRTWLSLFRRWWKSRTSTSALRNWDIWRSIGYVDRCGRNRMHQKAAVHPFRRAVPRAVLSGLWNPFDNGRVTHYKPDHFYIMSITCRPFFLTNVLIFCMPNLSIFCHNCSSVLMLSSSKFLCIISDLVGNYISLLPLLRLCFSPVDLFVCHRISQSYRWIIMRFWKGSPWVEKPSVS